MNMKKIGVLLLLTFIVGFHSLVAQDYNIYFGFNSDIMRINDLEKLRQLIADFDPKTKQILLIGHTDTVGNYHYNLDLSKKRTQAVKSFLLKNGIEEKSIQTNYKGKEQPATTDQFFNRRVEVFFVETNTSKLSFQDFRNSLKPKMQKFIIPTNMDIEIEGARGTIISIPARAFVDQTGEEIEGEVEVNLTEFYSMSDFFSENLTTISQDEIISSAGMINLQVIKDKQTLELKKNTHLEIFFPKTNDEKYFTFYGQRTDTGAMNWEQSKEEEKNTLSSNNLGVTIDDKGFLIVTDKATAAKRNSIIRFNPLTKKWIVPTEEENKEIQKYYDEQKRINERRDLYYYPLQSTKLGYINCDRFLFDNLFPSTLNYKVDINNKDVNIISAVLILRNTNSILSFDRIQKDKIKLSVRFTLQTLQEKAEILIIGTKEDNQPYWYYSPVKLEKDKKEKVDLVLTTYEQIRGKL